ncbi:hypothetical protein [Devosia sp. Naph2]|uniref:hypothetical protein n=1 Tax=Devosia polycyclovorans TaxID=3345148 RepID=UPI0035CE87BB
MPRPATTSSPRLTAKPPAPQHDAARAALLAFVEALAEQQAIEDHLAETGQDEVYDPRRDLRPL